MVWPVTFFLFISALAIAGRVAQRNLIYIPCLALGVFSAFRGNFGTDSAPYLKLYDDLDISYILFIEPAYWLYLFSLKFAGASYLLTQVIIAVCLVHVLFKICKLLGTQGWDFIAGFFATGYYAFLGGQRQAIALLILLWLALHFARSGTQHAGKKHMVALICSCGFHYSALLGSIWMMKGKHLLWALIFMAATLDVFREYFLPKILAEGSFDPQDYGGFKRFVPLFEIGMFYLTSFLPNLKNRSSARLLRRCAAFGCVFAVLPWIDPQFANLSGRALLYYRALLVFLLFSSTPPTWYRISFVFVYIIPKALISYDQWFFDISDWNQPILGL